MNSLDTKTNATIPVVAAVVTHEVADYDTWQKAYEGHASARRQASIVAAHVNRSADAPNVVMIYLAATNESSLRDFLGSDDIKRTMKAAGVISPPQIALVTPIEDLTVKDRPLAGAIVKHEVADYAAWKKVFDEHATTRAAAGIIGHALNRSVDKPNLVVIYLQSESLAKLQAFGASADLKATMQRAGVVGAPTVTFVQGQSWGN